MNVYKAEAVRAAVKISKYLEDRGVKVSGSRAVAEWRDGKRMSVSIDDEKGVWNDHVADEGGDIFTLCEKIEGLDFLAACRTLGDRYGVEPIKKSVKPPKVTRGDMLRREGYQLVKSYQYDRDDGSPAYWVDRWEKFGEDGKREDKEFVQRGPNGHDLQGVERTIYHAQAVRNAQLVFVCEGEKDADTLTALGLTATTNSGGAKTWEARFGKRFDGKSVVMLLDNDEAGQERVDIVGANIANHALSVKVITPSKLPKGDVTDWMESEGGSISELMKMVEAAKPIDVVPQEIAAARLANAEPLRNFIEEEYTDAKGNPKTRRNTRRLGDICDDIATRFLGFPMVLGSSLFDFMKDRKKVLMLPNEHSLHAWMDGTSEMQSEFVSGVGFASYKSVYERLYQTRRTFEVIANAPWWPERQDAFCAFDKLPPPDPAHKVLNELIGFFLPASDADRTLIKAFFCAPMFYCAASRPAWIVDTVDAQGSGKTTVVKACSWIYNEIPISFDLETLKLDGSKIKREILSSDGRKKRMVLFDNVTGTLKSGSLADFVTAQAISGMAPYGRGVETRTNDITWCATVNGASVDTDMATRSYSIHVRKPAAPDPFWEKRLRGFISDNRGQIHADIMYLLEHAKPRRRKSSRFGEFDAVVLSAVCATDEDFAAADEKIREASEAANDDSDLAAQCVEAITDALVRGVGSSGYEQYTVRPDLPCVIKCSDVDDILRRTSGGVKNWTSRIVRKFVNGGHIPNIVKGVERITTADGMRLFGRSRCFIFAVNPDLARRGLAQFISFDGISPRVIGEANA